MMRGTMMPGYGRLRDQARTGIPDKELRRLAGALKPLAVPKMLLAAPPPRASRFGLPLKLSKVHWVRPRWSWKLPT